MKGKWATRLGAALAVSMIAMGAWHVGAQGGRSPLDRVFGEIREIIRGKDAEIARLRAENERLRAESRRVETRAPAPRARPEPRPARRDWFGKSEDEDVEPRERRTPSRGRAPARTSGGDVLAGIAVGNEGGSDRCGPRSQVRANYANHEVRWEREHGRVAPYTCRTFPNLRWVDVEHIVPRAEAIRSGLSCDRQVAFMEDYSNITVAGAYVNRSLKSDKDPASWLPELSGEWQLPPGQGSRTAKRHLPNGLRGYNTCWFLDAWVGVKRKYGLSMDREEARVVREKLGACQTRAWSCPPPSTLPLMRGSVRYSY